MDSKGIATIDFLFTIFLMLIISIGVLNLIEDKLNTTKNIEEDIQGRLILNKVSDSINQLNSNGKGYSKKIDLPQSIANHNYIIIIESNEIILEYDNKKGKSIIFPIKLVNSNNELINEVKIYSGNSYLIKNFLNENNITMIQIYQI